MRIVKPVGIEVVGGNGYRMKVMVRDMEHRMSAISHTRPKDWSRLVQAKSMRRTDTISFSGFRTLKLALSSLQTRACS